MDIEKEELKLRLMEAQAVILQYQHRDLLAAVEAEKLKQLNNKEEKSC
jgi:hypothetical protein